MRYFADVRMAKNERRIALSLTFFAMKIKEKNTITKPRHCASHSDGVSVLYFCVIY